MMKPFSPCRRYTLYGGQFRISASGFTLIEVLVVIAIIAIIAGIATSGSLRGWLAQRGLSKAADQLRGDLQRARLLAVKQQTNCTITINQPGLNQYTILLNNQVVDLGNYPGNVTFTGPSAAVVTTFTFTPWGTCTAGEIQLTSQSNATVYRLRLSGAGGISKQIWNGATWVASGT